MRLLPSLVLLLAASPIAAATVSDMKGTRRVLVVAAPAGDAGLARQRAMLETWREGAAARDVSVVEVAGGAVRGSDDRAATLRRRYGLAAGGFGVVLLGKDGDVALRSARPIGGAALQAAIDAMPMRRAGQR